MTKSKFQLLISSSLLAQIMAVVLYEKTFYNLPQELQYFILKSEQFQENSVRFWVIPILSLILICYLIFVLIAMFKLKNYARKHAVIFTCIGTFTYLFFDLEINTGLVSIFKDAGNVIWGIVLGSMFYSDLKVHFDSNDKDA